MNRIVATLTQLTLITLIVAFVPSSALADGALTNGATHTGVIQPGGLDTWTFAAAKNDSITLSIGWDAGSVQFSRPRIRLIGPDGATLDDQFGNVSAQIDRRAPLNGTYTVRISNRDDGQTGPSTYALTLAKTPGPYTVSVGDEGGPLSSGPHSAVIAVGDLDAWTFQAAANNSITISVGIVPGASNIFFRPWIRLKGPDGASLGDQFGNSSAVIDLRVPLTGTYTVLVANRDDGQVDTADYVLTVSGPSPVFSVAAVLAVVGSTQGNGAFFRTGMQIHNSRASSIAGRFVFHTQGVSAKASDPSLAYTLNAGQTIDYPDLLPAMGIASGLGSLDITTNGGDPVPIISARVFSDAGENGTAGFFIEPVPPDAALQTGDSGVLLAPSDPVKARLNLGVRSLETGATLQLTVRTKSGVVRGTTTKPYTANFFEQVPANTYLGLTLDGSDTITFTVTSGKAIIYGAQTDNKTQDPSVQYAKKTF